MVGQYTDNILVYFFKIVAVFSIYGILSATLFFFLAAFLIFLYVHRKLYSSRLYDDDDNLPKYVNNPSYENTDYENNSVLHNQYFAVLRALFYFYSFLWFMTYFGVARALYLYAFFSLLSYVYLYAWHDFRGYERSYLNKISLMDPRPGFYRSSTLGGVDDEFAFKFLEDFSTKPFLDTRFQILQSPKHLGGYGGVNILNVMLTKDPYFLSKFLYYYADIYVYNSIHNFWVEVSRISCPDVTSKRVFKDSENYVGGTQIRFYPTEHFGLIDMLDQFSPTATYIKSQTFLFNTLRDVYRSTAIQSFSDSLYLRYLHDPFFRLGVTVSTNTSCFPHYKEDFSSFSEFRSLLESFLLAPARLDFLLHRVKEEFGVNNNLLRDVASNFNLKARSTIFNLFPKTYYFKWLSYFLSFFLTETSLNLRFKNILIPEHWYNLLSMYRYKRKPSRSRAGLHFSRLWTAQMRYNTDYTYRRGILEFVFNSYLYPVNDRSKTYYYLNGFTRFNMLESFDFVSLLVEPLFMFPAKAYVNRVRAYVDDSQRLNVREPLKVFDIRKFIRKSGDGMEPFISVDYFMYTNNVNFINDLDSMAHNDDHFQGPINNFYENLLPAFSNLANNSIMAALRNFDFKSSYLLNMLLFVGPSWLTLKNALESSPTFKIYLKNLVYNKPTSEFYEWFAYKNASKPLFHLYELSLDLLVKSPIFLRIVEGTSESLAAPGISVLGNTLVVFGNYQNLVNRIALKSSLGYKRLAESRPGQLAFKLGRIKRSMIRRVSSIPRPYKKPYIYFSRLPFINFSMVSPLSILKFTNFGLLERKEERSKLRILFRDPFLFFNKNKKIGKGELFRRFLWSNIFLKPVFAAAIFCITTPPSKDFSKNLSTFLLKNLSIWLQDRYAFSQTYINYIFSDLAIFREYVYFYYNKHGLLKNFDLWDDLSKNQFEIPLWKSYLNSIFSDNLFYSYSMSRGYCPTFALSSLLLDRKASMNFLFEIKNNYVLQFPTKYMNFMAIRSSEGSMNFGRSTWKLFVSTLNALVYLLVKSVLSDGKPDFGNSFDNFLILLEQLKRDLKAYNYITKRLFLTLDPLFDFKRMLNIIPEDTGLPLYSINKAKGVDWWEGVPNNTVFKSIEHALQLDLYKDSAINKHKFNLYMADFWDDFSKCKFTASLNNLSHDRLPSSLVLKIFNRGVSRASVVAILTTSSLSSSLKKIAYTIFLNEFRTRDSDRFTLIERYNESLWGLDSFYGVKDLSNYFFSTKVVDSSDTESYFSDARFFYTGNMESSLSIHRTPIGFRSRLGAFRSSHLFSLTSLNNISRSGWYYSLFTKKPLFHHERLSLNISNNSDHIFLNEPYIGIKFSRISFFYFFLYWFVKQFSLFFNVTARYSIKYYRFNCVYDPLRGS